MVEGMWFGMQRAVVALRSTNKSTLAEHMSVDNGKLGQKLDEHLSHFYQSSC